MNVNSVQEAPLHTSMSPSPERKRPVAVWSSRLHRTGFIMNLVSRGPAESTNQPASWQPLFSVTRTRPLGPRWLLPGWTLEGSPDLGGAALHSYRGAEPLTQLSNTLPVTEGQERLGPRAVITTIRKENPPAGDRAFRASSESRGRSPGTVVQGHTATVSADLGGERVSVHSRREGSRANSQSATTFV